MYRLTHILLKVSLSCTFLRTMKPLLRFEVGVPLAWVARRRDDDRGRHELDTAAFVLHTAAVAVQQAQQCTKGQLATELLKDDLGLALVAAEPRRLLGAPDAWLSLSCTCRGVCGSCRCLVSPHRTVTWGSVQRGRSRRVFRAIKPLWYLMYCDGNVSATSRRVLPVWIISASRVATSHPLSVRTVRTGGSSNVLSFSLVSFSSLQSHHVSWRVLVLSSIVVFIVSPPLSIVPKSMSARPVELTSIPLSARRFTDSYVADPSLSSSTNCCSSGLGSTSYSLCYFKSLSYFLSLCSSYFRTSSSRIWIALLTSDVVLALGISKDLSMNPCAVALVTGTFFHV